MANIKQLYDYKGGGCKNCGMSVHEMLERFGTFDRIFEFNHVDPANKSPEYDNLIRRKLSSEQLDEVDKCVLLCRNCHGILHSQAITGHLEMSLELDGRTTTQKMPGQYTFDKRENRLTFITNERLLTIPYLLCVDEKDAELKFGTELEHENYLLNLILNLKPGHRLGVLAHSDEKTLLCAESHDDVIKVAIDVKFPVFTLDLCESGPKDQILWVRHGIALHKNGDIIKKGVINLDLEPSINGG
jgi:hypothetical protein